MLRIVAVGFLDWQTTGIDTFFVQINDDQVMLYSANRNGTVQAVVDKPAPLRFVTASIEKFNNMYRVDSPIDLPSLDQLPRFLGRFEIISDTACRFVG